MQQDQFDAVNSERSDSTARTSRLYINLFIASLIVAVLVSLSYITSMPLQANSISNTVLAGVNVPSVCTLTLSNSLITFPSTVGGSNAPVANAVTTTNQGNIQGYLWLYGSNWVTSANTAINFFVSNTIFTNVINQYGTPYLPNTLPLSAANSAMLLPATIANTLYFGVNIPSGQAANSYNQNIVLQDVC